MTNTTDRIAELQKSFGPWELFYYATNSRLFDCKEDFDIDSAEEFEAEATKIKEQYENENDITLIEADYNGNQKAKVEFKNKRAYNKYAKTHKMGKCWSSADGVQAYEYKK